jgi:hypothetical protein
MEAYRNGKLAHVGDVSSGKSSDGNLSDIALDI